MPSRLTNLTIQENTLCRAGANPGARVVLFKRGDVAKIVRQEGDKFVIYSHDGSKKLGGYGTKVEAEKRLAQIEGFKHMKKDDVGLAPAYGDEGGETTPSTFSEELLERRIGDVLCDMSEMTGALSDAVRSAIEHANPADVAALVKSALSDFGDAVLGSIDNWAGAVGKADGLRISADRLNRMKGAHAHLGAMINEQDPEYHPGGKMPEKEKDMTEAEKKAADDKTAQEAANKKLADDAAVEKARVAQTAMEKSIDERVTKAVEAAVAPIQKENESLKKALDDERDLRETTEIHAMADKDLAGYPGTIEEKVATVKALRKSLPKEAADKQIDGMKKAAAAVRASGAFTEIGTDAGGAAGGSPADQLRAIAQKTLDEVRKSGDNKMTFEKAYARACDENRALYQKYMEEHASGRPN